MNFKFNEIFIKIQFLIFFNFKKSLRFFTFIIFLKMMHLISTWPVFRRSVGAWACTTQKGCTKLHFCLRFSHTLQDQKTYPNVFGQTWQRHGSPHAKHMGSPTRSSTGILQRRKIRTGLNRNGGRAVFQTCVNAGGSWRSLCGSGKSRIWTRHGMQLTSPP